MPHTGPTGPIAVAWDQWQEWNRQNRGLLGTSMPPGVELKNSYPCFEGMTQVHHKNIKIKNKMTNFNSVRPVDAYMHHWTRSSLIQGTSCLLLGAKPLPEPMMTYCLLDPRNKLQWNFNQNAKTFFKSSICKIMTILPRSHDMFSTAEISPYLILANAK